MSKSFILDPYYQKRGAKSLKNIEWEVIPSKVSSNYFNKIIKEVEDRLLKEAKDKAIHIQKEAYEKGFAQGERDGLEFGRRRFDILVQQFKNLLEEINKTTIFFYKQYEDDLINLILTIVRKILRYELSLNKNVVVETLREALQFVVDKQKIIVHLNPVDFQYLVSPAFGMPFLKDEIKGVELLEDSNVTRGGCFIETSFGDIDATIEGQLKKIEEFLHEKFKNNHDE